MGHVTAAETRVIDELFDCSNGSCAVNVPDVQMSSLTASRLTLYAAAPFPTNQGLPFAQIVVSVNSIEAVQFIASNVAGQLNMASRWRQISHLLKNSVSLLGLSTYMLPHQCSLPPFSNAS
jgi:hypothetical protein